MANTPKGYPYPLGTDRVMDGDDAIAALANAIDQRLGVAASGQAVTPAPTAQTTNATVAVTFPVGRFTAVPQVTTAAIQSASAPISSGASLATTAGVSLFAARLSGGLSGITVNWYAVQLP